MKAGGEGRGAVRGKEREGRTRDLRFEISGSRSGIER